MSDSKEIILQRLLRRISDEYDKSVGSFFYDTQMPLAIEHEAVYKKLEAILDNGFAATAAGVYLEHKAAEQGMMRKEAVPSEGNVRLSGNVGAVIPKGCKVVSDLAVYTILKSDTIPASGYIVLPVRCDTPGAIGNVPVGAIKDFLVSVSGLTAVTNLEQITGGCDAETDDELRVRYFEKVSAPAVSGSKQQYIIWAKAVDGVGGVKVIPLGNGAGSVRVIIVGADKQAANPTLVAKVRTRIEDLRPIGADVSVESAEPLTVNVSLTPILVSGGTEENALRQIGERLTGYLSKLTFAADYVSYAQVGGYILSCEDVRDYSGLIVNGGVSNIIIAENRVPVLGGITIV